jgi:uncharacterized protein (DUF58 family)
MSTALADHSPVDLTLQSLLDTRFEVHRLRTSTLSAGRDFPGQRLAAKRGQGIEFLDLRPYTAGDDVRHIDWNVTARSNEPYTRLYQQEKELNTTVIVDLRPVMFNGSTCLRSVSSSLYAAATLWLAHSVGDRCAAIVIDGNGATATRPLPGHKGVLQALELIANRFQLTAKSIQANEHRAQPSLSEAIDLVVNRKRGSSRYFLFSGFDTDDDSFTRQLPVIGALGNLSAIVLIDKMEQQALPAGSYRFRYRGKNHHIRIDNATGKAVSDDLRQQLTDRLTELQHNGISSVALQTDASIGQYLSLLQQRNRI